MSIAYYEDQLVNNPPIELNIPVVCICHSDSEIFSWSFVDEVQHAVIGAGSRSDIDKAIRRYCVCRNEYLCGICYQCPRADDGVAGK